LSRINNLQPNYLASIVWIESTAQPCAISPSVIVNGTKVHAKGLGQLMPGTASYLGVNDVFEPESNLEGAAKYFSEQLMDANGDLLLAASAYNYGPRALNKPFNQLPKETQDYTRKFGKFLDLFHEDAWRDFLPRIIPRTNTKICESAIALENS
jgi:soluble lytic murein transglycosylase-like protein